MITKACYTRDGSIVVIISGQELIISDNMANRHRQMLAEWVAEGNTIAPYAPPKPNIEDYRAAIQAHVDATAQTKNYDSGNSLASYVASTNAQWAGEAQAFVAWRDAVWLYAYTELDKVMRGEREQPSVEAFVAELPAIEWSD